MRAKRELVEYMDKEMKRGIHVDRIKEALYRAGHKTEHVEQAVSYLDRRRSRRTFLVVASFIVIIAVLLGISFTLMKQNNVGIVDSFLSQEARDKNAYSQALNSQDVTYCSSIFNRELRESCISLGKAEQPIPRREMYDKQIFTDAMQKGDTSRCGEIYDDELMVKCRSIKMVSAVSHGYVSQEVKDKTLFSEALANQDGALCSQIIDAELKQECYSYMT